jgi:hypothetical protein
MFDGARGAGSAALCSEEQAAVSVTARAIERREVISVVGLEDVSSGEEARDASGSVD